MEHAEHQQQPPAAGDAPAEQLVLQLRRLCSRQRLRAEERLFVRDAERALALLRQQQQQQHAPARSGSELAAAELELLFECLADLFAHRNGEVRATALETATLCLSALGERLGAARRRQVFALLLDAAAAGHPAGGDFALRQRMLRVLTHDGRHVEPFRVELGWLLLRLLEQSDEQRDLVALIQSILRRSPGGLAPETVVAIADVMCSRCDAAWGRGDVESCKKLLGFFHVLATHGLEHAASTPASLRTLCCMVNADGHGTWSITKHLLNGSAGFQVLRGLVHLLESPHLSSQWVLRGAVFFVGMSCWGSQRVGKLESVKWAPVLLALERALKCNNGVVIFEVILALQRLIKKFGAAKTDVDPKPPAGGGAGSDKRLIVEWDIILRMFRELRPWLSLAEDVDSDDGDSYSSVPSMMTYPQFPAASTSSSSSGHPALATPEQQQFSVSIHQTRIPRELLDTLGVVEDLVAQGKFAGEVEDFFDVLEDYLQHLNEGSTLFLLRHRAEAAHPASHAHWLQNLSDVMLCFFTNGAMLGAVRLEALEVLRASLHFSRNICEDRVIEDVLLPTLAHVFDDHHAEVRRRGLELVTEVARALESTKFDALLDVLANAVTLALYEDAQVDAAAGIVSLFALSFNHMPHTRSLRLYELVARLVETHRNPEVRRLALSCLLCVCEADVDFRLQWKDAQVRTSRFLYVARKAVRSPQTGACVPVARGLRALLTLVSTETHAELFRMAVSGIRVMLENRVVLTDVDVSDLALKIVSSIDYRAFGRAAIPDELARLTDEDKADSSASERAREAAASSRSNAWELLSRRNTESDVLRYASHQQRSSTHGEPGVFKSSLRDTLVVLCKTRFMTMGLELLALLTSYPSELNRSARHHLIACLVGSLEMQLAVAEKDLFAGGASSSSEVLAKPRSAADVDRDSSTYGAGDGSRSSGVSGAAHHPGGTSYHDRSPGLQERGASHSSKPASPPHFGFTTRMLSRFHPSASHGNLFSQAPSSAKPSAADREARERLQQALRAVYDAEFAQLFLSANVLSLLAVRAPEEVVADMELVLRSARVCFTTPDGDFRADGYGAMLEMLANVVYALPPLRARCYEAVVEILLIGFEYAQSKQLSYLAFRLLSNVVWKCAPADRVALAAAALPRLQQFQRRLNSLLIEAAIDFLMSFAFSRSFALSPAVLRARADADAHAVVQARSWVYKRAILTIQVTTQGSAELVIRRASSTSRWDLHLLKDFVVDPNTVRAVMPEFDERVGDASRCAACAVEGGRSADENDRSAANTSRPGDESADVEPPGPEDETASSDRSSEAAIGALKTESEASTDRQDSAADATTTSKSDAPTPSEPASAAQALPPPVPILHDAASGNSAKTKKRAGGGARKQVSFELRGNSPTMFPSAALPPLPAYDGIGGSPSYFCEAHPVRRRNPARVFNSARPSAKATTSAANGSASPLDGQLQSAHDDNEEDDGPDGFSLDGSSSAQASESDAGRPQPPSTTSASATTTTTTTTTAGSATSEQAAALDRREQSASLAPADDAQRTLDPMFLMMQLFDLTAEPRPQLLANGASLALGLNVLDRTPGRETHKIGLLYVRSPQQRTETDILRNSGGSLRYLQFLRGLGAFTKLQGLAGYTGGLDCANNSDGAFGLVYADDCAQIMFHVATLMGPASSSASSDRALAMSKKRHIGNDFVHVVYKECDAAYDVGTFSGQFNDVHIVVQPLNDREYRTQVHAKPGLKPFGPLHGTQVVASAEVAACVRLTCLNANLACQTFHQDLVGFSLNCEERLKQIKQLGIRLASRDEWQLDVQ